MKNLTQLESIREELSQTEEWLRSKTEERETNGSVWTAEEVAEVTEKADRRDALVLEKTTLEQCDKIKRSLDASKKSKTFGAPGIEIKRSVTSQDYANALRAWAMTGMVGESKIQDSWKRSADRTETDTYCQEFNICRAQSSDSSGEGEEFLNGSLFQDLVEAERDPFSIESYVETINSSVGSPIHFATLDDRGAKAKVSAQNVDLDTSSEGIYPLVYDKVELTSHTFKTGVFPVSLDLLQDAAFDITSHINTNLSGRLVESVHQSMTGGSGTGAMKGYAHASVGMTVYAEESAVAGATMADLKGLFFSIPATHRRNAVFSMNDTSYSHLVDVFTDDEGHPIWGDFVNNGASPTLFGRPIIINPWMTSYNVHNSLWCSFGNMKNYKLRYIGGPVLVKGFDAKKLAIELLAYRRGDGGWVNPGDTPGKLLKATTTGT